MPKRALLLLVLLALAAMPAAAQQPASPLDWIPADFDGFIRVDLARPNDMLVQLNMAWHVGSTLQPARATGTAQRRLNDYFPVDLFDTEGATFETTILPLLSDDLVIAYRSLGDNFAAAHDEVLLILPTGDAFAAAGVLSAVTTAQDFPAQSRYGGVTIFSGDRTAIAFTPSAVLVGPEPLLHAAIDADAGTVDRLADSADYAALSADSDDWPVFAYFSGTAPQTALSVLLKGDASAQPVLNAIGSALQPYNAGSLEASLLSDEIGPMALGLRSDPLAGTMRASVTLQTTADSPPDALTSDSNVLDYMPRNAMLVQHGSDARAALYDALVAAPAVPYFTGILRGAPATTAPAAPIPTRMPPDAQSIDAAVSGFVTALSVIGGYDLDDDLTAHLQGGYALALLPRPNNPAPGSGAPYDVLLIAESTDPDAAADGATALARMLLALDDDTFTSADGDAALRTLPGPTRGDPLLQIGVVDGKLVVGTGAAVDAALRAGAGDNRLINVGRWQGVSRYAQPMLYLDLNALFATFAPTPGGPVDSGIGQLGASVHNLGMGLYRFDVIVTLPSGI